MTAVALSFSYRRPLVQPAAGRTARVARRQPSHGSRQPSPEERPGVRRGAAGRARAPQRCRDTSTCASRAWGDNRMGSDGMGKEGATMEETLLWRFWREWGGNKHCRAMINGAPTRPSGGRNYVYRNPAMMEERVLTLRRLLVPDEDEVTMDLLEHIMRMPIKEPRVLSLSPGEMAQRLVDLRFASHSNVARLVINDPAVLLMEEEELREHLAASKL